MVHRLLPLRSLVVNPANDRHGELENETAAIAQLFATQELHMRNLAKDIVAQGEIFEPPLVYPQNGKYIVADGNRRTTCLKLISQPRRAPTTELQQFFTSLKEGWIGTIPAKIECRVEKDRDRVDDILYRRHTGVQGGIGQSNWNDRMKNNFVVRTGKGRGLNIADEIEKQLTEANLLPTKKIPRSNLNRLLSSETLRNRCGISVRKGKFSFIRNKRETLLALSRIAHDLASQKITLDNIWDTESKLKYIDSLDEKGVLPSIAGNADQGPEPQPSGRSKKPKPPATPARPLPWPHLIPEVDYGIVWTAQLQRHREIWEELQFRLELAEHPNAISVLLRILLELSVDNYVGRSSLATVHQNDKLSKKAAKVAADLFANGKIDKKYLGEIKKLHQAEAIVSIDTMNRYVHSSKFRVSPEHLKMLWGTLDEFLVLCLQE